MKVMFIACAALSWTGSLFACGTCVEDKIAATYDYRVMQDASRSGRVVVFCDVKGDFRAERLGAAARTLRGVDPKSVRMSQQPAAISFALDTRVQSVNAAVQSLERVAGPTRISVLRVGAGN